MKFLLVGFSEPPLLLEKEEVLHPQSILFQIFLIGFASFFRMAVISFAFELDGCG